EIDDRTAVMEIIGLAQFILKDRLFIRAQEVLGGLAPSKGLLVLIFAKWWHTYKYEESWDESIRAIEEYLAPGIQRGLILIKRVDVSNTVWRDPDLQRDLTPLQ
ncbi:MAG TPA: hypothetical protein VF771_04815, partial [Longimicrobiaceae bacterium]